LTYRFLGRDNLVAPFDDEPAGPHAEAAIPNFSLVISAGSCANELYDPRIALTRTLVDGLVRQFSEGHDSSLGMTIWWDRLSSFSKIAGSAGFEK
jgi:hypothetical protein